MSRLSSIMTRCLSRPVLSPQWSSSLLRRRFSVKAIYSSFPATLHYYSPRARSNLFDRGEIDSRLDYLIDEAVMVEKNGLVYPAVDAASGVSNGAVMLPNTFEMQEIVRGNLDEALDREAEMKQTETAFIYTIFKGTPIPTHLTLINEFVSRFSLQPSRGMPLKDLNQLLDDFYERHAHKETAENWLSTHPYQEAISDDADDTWMAR